MKSFLLVFFYSAALSLSVDGPTFVSPTRVIQSSDNATIGRLTEEYGQAIASAELEKMRSMWHPSSSSLPTRLRTYQATFSNASIEFTGARVTRVVVTGDKAVSHLTADERRVDRKTGASTTTRNIFHGACRAIEWTRTATGWLIEREFLVQDDLAGRLEATTTEKERDELLEQEKVFVTSTLIGALMTRGQRHRLRQDYDVALRCYQLQLHVSERMNDDEGIASAWSNLGTLKAGQDEYEQGLQLLQKALASYKAQSHALGAAGAHLTLAGIFRVLGDRQLAFEHGKESLRLFEKANHRVGKAEALTSLAYVFSAQNNAQQALDYLGRALAIAQEVGNPIAIATLRNDIAHSHQNLGNYDLALEIHHQLLKQTEGVGDRGGAAMIRGKIGQVFAAQGRHQEALIYFRQTLSVFESLNLKHDSAVALNNMSMAYLAQGSYADAQPLAERAVALSRQTGRQHDLWLALTALGYCQRGLNNPAQARESFGEAISIMEELRRQSAGGAEERQRYLEGRLRAHHGMLGLLANEGRASDALVLAEGTKARVLLDVLQQGQVGIQKAMTIEERQQEQVLKSELTRLNAQLARAMQSEKQNERRISELKPQLEKARLKHEAFQTSLYGAHPKLKVQRGEASTIKLEEITGLLPDSNTALLEYVVTDEATYLFAATKSRDQGAADIKLFVIPVKRVELTSQTESFRQLLARRDLGFRAPARKLYDLLLKPAQSVLNGKTSLVIVPDDKLWELPFQALLDAGDRYVIEQAAVSYVPSLTVLREMRAERDRRPPMATSSLLALGNPAIGNATVERSAMVVGAGQLAPLPEAEQEVLALRTLYGPTRSKVYVGLEAREDRAKTEAREAGILHFATHGSLNNAAPLYSNLVLAQGGANEDGLLEAWELMQLGLKADLAVLSACETARGHFGAGEGVIGLTWALFVAGVPATVVSQWKVESGATRELMVRFHTGLRASAAAGVTSKTTRAEALRRAALPLIKNPTTSNPFYWAAFVLIGDGR